MVKFMKITAIVALMFVCNVTVASIINGKIARYHLNSGIPGRGVCMQMQPQIPRSGWAYLYRGSILYQEITALLLAGYSAGRNCGFNYQDENSLGHKVILVAKCT